MSPFWYSRFLRFIGAAVEVFPPPTMPCQSRLGRSVMNMAVNHQSVSLKAPICASQRWSFPRHPRRSKHPPGRPAVCLLLSSCLLVIQSSRCMSSRCLFLLISTVSDLPVCLWAPDSRSSAGSSDLGAPLRYRGTIFPSLLSSVFSSFWLFSHEAGSSFIFHHLVSIKSSFGWHRLKSHLVSVSGLTWKSTRNPELWVDPLLLMTFLLTFGWLKLLLMSLRWYVCALTVDLCRSSLDCCSFPSPQDYSA